MKFIVFCEEAKLACEVDRFSFFEVDSLFFMSLIGEKDLNQRLERKQIFKRIREFNSLLKKGFYFSHNYNLMRSY